MQIRLCVRIMFCVCVLLVCPVSLHVLCLSCSTPVMWPRVSRRRSVHAQSPLFTFWILHFLLLFSFITVLIWLQYVNFHIWMKDIKEICEKKKKFFRNIRNQMVAKYKKRHSCHCIVILKILFLLGIRNPDLGKKWSQLMKGHWEANIIIY